MEPTFYKILLRRFSKATSVKSTGSLILFTICRQGHNSDSKLLDLWGNKTFDKHCTDNLYQSTQSERWQSNCQTLNFILTRFSYFSVRSQPILTVLTLAAGLITCPLSRLLTPILCASSSSGVCCELKKGKILIRIRKKKKRGYWCLKDPEFILLENVFKAILCGLCLCTNMNVPWSLIVTCCFSHLPSQSCVQPQEFYFILQWTQNGKLQNCDKIIAEFDWSYFALEWVIQLLSTCANCRLLAYKMFHSICQNCERGLFNTKTFWQSNGQLEGILAENIHYAMHSYIHYTFCIYRIHDIYRMLTYMHLTFSNSKFITKSKQEH